MATTEEEKLIEIAIAKAMPEIGDYIVFAGNDACEDSCAGWNQKDARCECGNRRVCWALEKQEDGSYFAFAEAW